MSEANDAGVESVALLTLLRTQEENLLAADQRASPETVAELLSDDFVEFARSGGIYDRDQTIAALACEGPTYGRKAFDFKLSLLGEGVALLTYRSTRQSAADLEEQHALRSSIWMRVGDGGGCVFTKARRPATLAAMVGRGMRRGEGLQDGRR